MPYLFAECATKLEDKYIEVNHINKTYCNSVLIGGYRPKRCCNKCASVGFHTELFDMPWLSICPIHNEILTKNCNTCNRSWPTASELRLTDCLTCGVKITIKDLLKASTNNTDEGYKLIDSAQRLQGQGYQLFSTNFYLYYYGVRRRNFDTQTLIYSQSAFYLSVVEKVLNKKNILCQLTKTFDIEKKTYVVTRIPPYPKNTDSEELLSLRLKIIKKTIAKFKRIYDHGDHVIGRCDTNNFPQEACLHCTTFNLWLRVIKYYHGKGYGCLLAMPHGPSTPKIYSTIFISGRSFSDEYCIKIPLTLSAKIYENDLWTTAMHLYQYLSYEMGKANNTSMFWRDFVQKNSRPIMLYYNSTFSPYVMKLTNDNLDVYFLKNILTTQLHENEKIDQLVNYSLNSL